MPCDRPVLEGDTYRDLAVYAVDQKQALDDCSERMDMIRSAVNG